MAANILFQPVKTCWFQFQGLRRKTQIEVLKSDSLSRKGLFFLANGVKNRLLDVALAVSLVFAFFYSLISYPIRWYQSKQLVIRAIYEDRKRLAPEEVNRTEAQIRKYFDKHQRDFRSLSLGQKEKLIDKICAYSARSQKIYGPVIRHFVDHLLETANRDNKKLVFLARDAIPYYQLAIKLMAKPEYAQKYPNLVGDDRLVLAHMSRKLLRHAVASTENQSVFDRYVRENLQIQEGDQCTFIDIGFEGSMIKEIRALFPKVAIDFTYLISMTDAAQGYLGDPSLPLRHFESKENNPGMRWLEESHNGTLASSTKLVVGEDDKVYPENIYPQKKRFQEKFSEQYLLKKFCSKDVVEYAADLPEQVETDKAKAKTLFSETIGNIRGLKLPIFIDWDY